MGVIGLVTAVLGLATLIIQIIEAHRVKVAPDKVQEETDANLVSPDSTRLSLQLQRLLAKARNRRPPRQPPTDPGDQVP